MSPHTHTAAHTQCLWTAVELWRVQTWEHSSQTDSWLEGQSNLLVQEPQDNLSQTNHIKTSQLRPAERWKGTCEKHPGLCRKVDQQYVRFPDIRKLTKGRVDTAHTHRPLFPLGYANPTNIHIMSVFHQLFLCSVSPSTQIQLTFEGRQQWDVSSDWLK